MNTKTIISAGIAIGLASFSIGVLIGVRLESDKKDKEYQEKIKELRDHYNRKTKCRENEEQKEDIYKKTIADYSEESETPEFNKEKKAPSFEKLVNEMMENKKQVEEILAESESPQEEYDDEMTEDDIDREEWETKSIWAAEKKDPYIITFDEYEQHPEMDKITLLFYEGDGTLTTEDEELIEDVKGAVGNCLDDFEYSDENTMFVRNKKLGIDYEIAKVKASFY